MKHFLVVGLGSIGRRHAHNLREHAPDARFTFVRHGGDGDGFGAEFGARVVGTLDEAVDEPIDLAVVATPSADHIAVLPDLIARACPLLVEKPVVTTLDDCDAIERALAEAPPAVRAAVFNLRYLDSLRALRDAVTGGRLGDPVRADLVAGQWLPSWRPTTDYRASYSAHEDRGGGVELDLCHEIDAARWLFGELEVEFSAAGRLSGLDLQSNDTSVSVLRGVERQPPLVTISLDYVSRPRVRRYEVVLQGGRIVWDLDGILEEHTDEGSRTLDVRAAAFDVASTYVDMIQSVMRSVETGVDDGIQSLADGVASTRLALAVRAGSEPA
jgi:predicted dehydrogenase